jgi:hypothetical protein
MGVYETPERINVPSTAEIRQEVPHFRRDDSDRRYTAAYYFQPEPCGVSRLAFSLILYRDGPRLSHGGEM